MICESSLEKIVEGWLQRRLSISRSEGIISEQKNDIARQW